MTNTRGIAVLMYLASDAQKKSRGTSSLQVSRYNLYAIELDYVAEGAY